jgi:hypothetical protein
MSVVPHTRTHGLDLAAYQDKEDPFLLRPVTEIQYPVQFRVRDNGYPDDPQRWSYTPEVYNLLTLIDNFQSHGNF